MLRLRPVLVPLLATLLAACATAPPRVQVPAALTPQVVEAAPASERMGPAPEAVRTGLREIATPLPPNQPSGAGAAAGGSRAAEPPLSGPAIRASLEGLPLPSFINEAFGNLLKLNFQVDPTLASRPDLVTLRLPEPQSPRDFYRLSSQVLRAYGIAVTWDGTLVKVEPSDQADASEPPLIISGRALPDVPVSHRPVFQLVELSYVRVSELNTMLKIAFSKQSDLRIEEDLNRNAVVLFGKPDTVRQVLAAIRVLDRPHMRGRHSIRLEPAFVGAPELAQRLVEVLSAQGYAIGTGMGMGAGTLVMPVASANMVLVFAPDAAVLRHVVEWARTIDRPSASSSGDSLYYYQVKNTRAADIVATLSNVQAQGGGSIAPAAAEGAARPAAPTAASVPGGGRLAVDEPRNAIIFQGSAAEWQRMLSLVEKMDRAARQVMVEVTIAEVTLDDGEKFGMGWFAKGGLGRFGGRLNFGTVPASNSGASTGLTYLLDVAGENRLALNAFANDNRVSILSTPRLLVKSGGEASIDVGTEVPTITSQTTSPQQTEGNSGLLQSIQYRKTGILLNVKPTVYSDDRIDLDISQEVSEALPLETGSGLATPSILNRKIETSLSLRDGGSVMLGGLMSQGETDTDGGIPYLKDVPLLGNLFKNQEVKRNRTELVLIIRPYIIENNEDAEAVTQAMADQLEFISVPPTTLQGVAPASLEPPRRDE